MIKQYIQKNQLTIVLLIIGVVACYAIYETNLSAPFGPGFGSDSVTYMESAKNLASGKGLGLINPDGSFRLLPYTAPFYPLFLSIFVVLGLDLMKAAFWMNALLFGVMVFILGWGVRRYVRSNLAAILTAVLLAFSGLLIGMSGWIMSDTLSLVLGMGGLLTMIAYLEGGIRKYFYWSAALSGLAFLTRYAGAAYCVAGVLAVVLLGSKSIKDRLLSGLMYGVISIIPMLIWIVIDLSVAGAVGSRSLQPLNAWLPRFMEVIRALKEAMYQWIPYFLTISQSIGQTWFRLLYLSLIIFILTVLIYGILHFRRTHPDSWRQEIGWIFGCVFIIFLGMYYIFINITYAIYYPPLTLSNRMFAPLNVDLLVLVSLIVGILYKLYRGWLPRLVTILLTIILGVAFYGSANAEIAHSNLYPPEYAGFRDTGLISYVQSLPPDIPLISDKAPMILYYTGRPTYPIQELFSSGEQNEFLAYGSNGGDDAQRAFRERGGALILTWLVQREFSGLYGDQADERYAAFIKGLYLAFDSPEGKVYFFQAPGN